MYRFFDPVIRPLLEVARPQVVVEIGSDRGYGTELLVDWCHSNGAILHSVDPLPKYDVDDWMARWPGTLICHRHLSLNALPDIGAADFVCIDGDHNWYTVSHELEILSRSATAAGRAFPLTLLHDVGWPYGRRDLYYDPDTIPGAFRHPHRKGGLVPEEKAISNRGFNDHLENAIHEGTPRNGVRTAVEDFVSDAAQELLVKYLPGIHGLGMIVDKAASDEVVAAMERTFEAPTLLELLDAVERDRVSRLLAISKLQRDLEREVERVVRARGGSVAKAEKVKKLEKVISEKTKLLRDQKQEIAKIQLDREALQARLEDEDRMRARIERERAHLSEELQREREKNRELAQANELRLKELASTRGKADLLQRDINRLRNRRSVRLALGAASVARPVFRLRRGQLRKHRPQTKDTRREDKPSVAAQAPPSSGRAGESQVFLPADRSQFSELLHDLSRSPLPAPFVEAWNASQIHPPALDSAGGPLVSIIMPTYNRGNLIGQAIRSALDQTYENWELLVCDDASEDQTHRLVAAFEDPRIKYALLPKGGAAAARNAGLGMARGEIIAYLDSDNVWHPHFLDQMVSNLLANPGRYSAYARYIDVQVTPSHYRVKKYESIPFDFERLSDKNYIDLNVFAHRRSLYDNLGGFDERLARQQDWALIIKYSYLRDPLYVDHFLMIYRRNEEWKQITELFKHDRISPSIVRASLDDYYRHGLPNTNERDKPSLSVLSWDVCRNHFSKAYNVAEAMAEVTDVQLLGFRFFGEEVFPPYRSAEATFETLYLPGGSFPEWSSSFAQAVAATKGDVVYAVKPRLPSLGAALLANYHFGKPVVVEYNDLESVVTTPRRGGAPSSIDLSEVDLDDPELMNPYGQCWTEIMEGLVSRIPLRVTHNRVLDEHFGGGAFFVRNPKDEQHFDPTKHQREQIRRKLGIEPGERVILFGGMVRRHKGIFEVAEAIQAAGERYRLLVVGSRDTPDLTRLREAAGERVKIVDSFDRNEMASINLACDAVILWLDPDVPASHYQMPFKLTDALAMRVPVLANDIGDLGDLGREGLLRLVPFGDVEALQDSLHALFADRDGTEAMVDAGRRLYLRQFSYSAVQRNLAIILGEAAASPGTLEVAEDFARFFAEFTARVRMAPQAPEVR